MRSEQVAQGATHAHHQGILGLRPENRTRLVYTTGYVAKRLGVSENWVRDHAVELGGRKETRSGERKQWWFDADVVVIGRSLIETSGMKRTQISVCETCGKQVVVYRGRLGVERSYFPKCVYCAVKEKEERDG